MKLETQMKIATNLKMLRTSKGLSQTEIAAMLDIDRSSFALYESGRRIPDAEALLKIARYFGIRMELLLEVEPDKIVSEAIDAEICEEGERELLSLFRAMTLFSRGRLLEKAQELVKEDHFRAEQRKVLKARLEEH